MKKITKTQTRSETMTLNDIVGGLAIGMNAVAAMIIDTKNAKNNGREAEHDERA